MLLHKETSAFEPYKCSSYRPYVMAYHDRACTKYDRNESLQKYKVISPKCDHCEYRDLKRKSTSSLENIIVKLKKSRNDDKDEHHFTSGMETVGEQSPRPSYKSSPTYPLCPRMPDNEKGCRDVSTIEYGSAKKEMPVEKYNYDTKHLPADRFSEINDTNEKSSFVTLLEQQDDINYASTLSMASALGTASTKFKSENKSEYGSENELEKLKDSKHLFARSVASKPYTFEEAGDSIDKIAETKCDKCNKRFYRKSQLIRHISNHVVHECHKCNAFFYCVRKFKKHMSTHESYPCEFCEEEFYEASAWYHHRAKHTMVECSSCDMIFYNKTALLKHKFTHLQYICPVCRFPFSNLNHWISHRSCHKTFGSTLLTPLFSCRECSTTFPSQDTYMKHSCLHRQKKSREPKRSVISKRDITDLIGVDQTAK